MSFYRRIKYFLVHTLKHTNKDAQSLIETGAVQINGLTVFENCLLDDEDEILLNGKKVRNKKEFVYILFNKPVGFESTLNKNIEKNISNFFAGINDLVIAGRLDKQSQGLMLLSNNGKWVEHLCNPKFEKEKEYLVTLDKPTNDLFLEKFRKGVEIDNYLTKPCFCEKTNSENTIRVILTEGKNRQIRKMCLVLGYKIIILKRVRIDQFLLEDLPEGKFKFTKI